jgi:CHAD domain-containing protein
VVKRRRSKLRKRIGRAPRDGEPRKTALGVAVAAGAVAAAKLGWERMPSPAEARRFRLANGEPPADGIRRIAAGQLDQSIERLDGKTDEDLATAVHEVRKSLKRLRTTARLARDALGPGSYRHENRRFRDAGRRLSGARDSRVLVETLDALCTRHPDVLASERFRRFREALVEVDAEAVRALGDNAAVAEVSEVLREARVDVESWPLDGDRAASLATGFERLYRRGRRAARAAKDEPSVENLHELRKRVKDLWYAAQILRPVAAGRMKRIARAAHDLSDLLGEDHDLALLAHRTGQERAQFADDEAIDDLRDAIAERRDKLGRRALSAARKLYRAKPRKVAAPVRKAAARA